MVNAKGMCVNTDGYLHKLNKSGIHRTSYICNDVFLYLPQTLSSLRIELSLVFILTILAQNKESANICWLTDWPIDWLTEGISDWRLENTTRQRLQTQMPTRVWSSWVQEANIDPPFEELTAQKKLTLLHDNIRWGSVAFLYFLGMEIDYISQAPLKLDQIIWLSSDQWIVGRSYLGPVPSMLRKNFLCNFQHSLSFTIHWINGENSQHWGESGATRGKDPGSLNDYSEEKFPQLPNDLSCILMSPTLGLFLTSIPWSDWNSTLRGSVGRMSWELLSLLREWLSAGCRARFLLRAH